MVTLSLLQLSVIQPVVIFQVPYIEIFGGVKKFLVNNLNSTLAKTKIGRQAAFSHHVISWICMNLVLV